MYRVSKTFNFCYGHRLFEDEGKCRRLHGHNGRVEVVIRSETLDSNGMVCDFREIKRVIGGWIDENLDHRMLLSRYDPLAAVLKEQGEQCYLFDGNPTAEAIARLIYEVAQQHGFPVEEVRLWETSSSCATCSGPACPAPEKS